MKSSLWTDRFLDALRYRADPTADAVVAAVFAHNDVDAVNTLFRSLVEHDQPEPRSLPPEVRRYFAQTLDLPPWADRDRIRRGEDLFQRLGPQLILSLLCAGLPSAYAAKKGGQVLHRTGRLQTDPKRRIMETAQLVMDVMAPGGLDADGRGVRTAQKVRLMHAAIRHLIRNHPRWGAKTWDEKWGTPINQEDLAGTLLTFSWQTIDTTRKLDARITRDDAEAYLHAWNVVGFLLGVDEDLLPTDMDEAGRLAGLIRKRQFAASLEGKEMTQALVEMMKELCPGRIFDGVPAEMIVHMVGHRTARMIGLQASWRSYPWYLATLQVMRLTNFIETNFFALPNLALGPHRRMAGLAEPFSRMVLEHVSLVPRGPNRSPFQIPTALRDEWKITDPPPVAAARARADRLAQQVMQAEPARFPAARVRAQRRSARGEPAAPPDRPWQMSLHWEDLLFAHWAVPEAAVRALLPDGLEPDTFGGRAWLSIVSLHLSDAQFNGLPKLPAFEHFPEASLGDFPELNVRTYVRYGGQQGVHFLSIDVPNWIMAKIFQHAFHLPSHHAEMSMTAGQPPITFRSRRTELDGPAPQYRCRYGPVGDELDLADGSLDRFLHVRDRMYIADEDGNLYRGEVAHPPWQLYAAEAMIDLNTMAEALRLPLPDPLTPDLRRYARATQSLGWPLERVEMEDAGGGATEGGGASVPVAAIAPPGRARRSGPRAET